MSKFFLENGNFYLLKFDEDTNSIVNLKKSEEEDFLKYECSEKVKKVIDLERIHQIKLTKEFDNFMNCQLKDRLDKYRKNFKMNAVLFKEFWIIKYDIETQEIQKKIEKKQKQELQNSRALIRIKSACLKSPTGAKIHEDNQKQYKSRKCNIFEELNKIPVVNPVKGKITGNTCMKIVTRETGKKNISNSLPEYFYFKKFNKEEFDRIYKRYT